MCSDHIVIKELQGVAIVSHKLAFHLYGKGVAQNLDNSIAKLYVINKGGTESLSLCRMIC